MHLFFVVADDDEQTQYTYPIHTTIYNTQHNITTLRIDGELYINEKCLRDQFILFLLISHLLALDWF